MKKPLFFLLLCLFLFSLFSACSTKNDYATDIPVSELTNSVLSALDDDVHYRAAQDGYLNDYFTLPNYVSESSVCFAEDGNNLNEIGIYRVSPEHTDDMKELLQNYLSSALLKNEAWYNSYIPQETPKLRDAKVKIFGNYVVYAILSPKDQSILFQSIQNKLSHA